MHKVGIVISNGFQLMALSTHSVFEFANLVVKEPHYELHNYSITGGLVNSSIGITINTEKIEESTSVDTWLVGGVSNPLDMPPAQEIIEFLKLKSTSSRRIGSICTGAFVLAEAGLLNGRRATTHWSFARDLQRLYPKISVEEDRIYIIDDMVWSSAGMTAGLDLALAMVEKDLGFDVARSVAHNLVMHQRRSGGQSQHSELLKLSPKSDRIQNALNYARKNLKNTLSVEDLAEAAHLSARQFSRVFRDETGQSPAKAIESLRLETARIMIEQGKFPLATVAQETGFRDRRHLREVFVKKYGIAPQTLRQTHRPK
jgi:transcriptional regulator GlxA family with amidase domain